MLDAPPILSPSFVPDASVPMTDHTSVTLKDVAAEAQTSIATVSHFLNKTKPVGALTGQRIARAIERLGYQRDSMAAWFKTSRAPLVILAVASAETSFFSDVAEVIEELCERRGLTVFRVQVQTLENMRRGNAMSAFLRRATGIILLGHSEQWITDPESLAAKTPMVFLNWDMPSGFGQQGLIDHLADGTYKAMALLGERGHRHIGLVTGPLSLPRGQELMAGVRRYEAAHDIDLAPRWTLETSYAFQDAHDKVYAMLAKGVRPTAILTFGVQFAFAVLQAASRLRILVPDELSVISYIDARQADFSSPPLTTVSPSIPQLAGHVVEQLMQLVRGDRADNTTVLELIVNDRGSVRDLRR
ncbi:LacI family DNA-binding transcriptional regulator [Rugamonas sp.]|uniref:LacI family DNA-binding transcriptional regulator n=1 Tax=Rugamonas sp. TaxID=1926287 RepID=UPI0025E28FAE|nr:LacI family DNA-binding transcriptional regulator [Rugamonas sp.]